MRKIVLHMMISLDGYFEGPDADISWHRVDEYRIFVNPVLVGRGRRLFEKEGMPADLQLVETRAFGNGVVMLRHERRR